MAATIRSSLTWLHTWCGLALGTLLLAIFWTGSLSVFDREIDRWMMPETRFVLTGAPPQFDTVRETVQAVLPEGVRRWEAVLPSARQPVVRVYYQGADGVFTMRDLDPTGTRLLPDGGSWAGTRFLFPFHYRLHLDWARIGTWMVGFCGMAMLIALVSGVIIHRRIFTDFFTFRPDRRLARSSLDLHTVTGVIALPFHLVITLSGLVIMFAVYFPSVILPLYHGDQAAFAREAYGIYRRAPAGAPGGQPLSLEALADTAAAVWGGERPSYVRVWYPGDTASFVEFRPSSQHSVTQRTDVVYLDASKGSLLSSHAAKPVMTTQSFISGLHFIQFEHWLLRWLYFALGLTGCVTIATGLIYWAEARRKSHAGRAGLAIVQAMTVGSVTGPVFATCAFLIANRLLPAETAFLGVERHAMEIWVFFLAWAVAVLHGGVRRLVAWRPQCRVIAAAALLAAVLNAGTTGDHLISTLSEGLWGVAGVDAALLTTSALALLISRRLPVPSGSTGDASRG